MLKRQKWRIKPRAVSACRYGNFKDLVFELETVGKSTVFLVKSKT